MDNFEEKLIALRRHFHRHPELSWQEKDTQAFIMRELDGLGIPYTAAAGTGVIAEIRGKCSGDRVLGIRADMDALPVAEQTGCAFASENAGVSHACGHDCHTAILLGTAMRLAEIKDELKVTVRLIFQPAEECIERYGAKEMAKEKAVQECGRLIGLHIWSKIEAGFASLRYGAVTAATDTFDIEIRGKGGHGAMPHQTIDPLAAGVQMVNEIYRAAAREIHPLEPHVISVTSFVSGTAWNVIPDQAVLKGTARCFSEEVRKQFPELLERTARGVGASTRTEITSAYHYGPRPTVNDRPAVETGLKAAEQVFGKDHLLEWEPQMIGEDFACYPNEKCFLFLGGGFADPEKQYPQHSPYFEIDEQALKLGVEYFLAYVRAFEEEA